MFVIKMNDSYYCKIKKGYLIRNEDLLFANKYIYAENVKKEFLKLKKKYPSYSIKIIEIDFVVIKEITVYEYNK